MAHEYAQSDDLKTSLEMIGESFADDDIDLALTAASRAIDNLTGRRFWADATATVIRYYSPTAAGRLWIDDLVTLTEIAVDTGEDGTFEEVWTQNTDFYLEPLNAAADEQPYTTVSVNGRSSRYFPCAHRSVRVTGKFGWAAVPDGIVQATKIVASKLVKRAREAPFGVVSVGVDGDAVRVASNDPEVMLLVGPFVRTNFS